jgi:hypothetical protein
MAVAPSRLVPPLPDHVMVLLDDETYRDVVACDFLARGFCRVQTKTADSSVAGAYSTLGLAGTNTLLELFSGAVPGPRRYTGGLVFSFEQPQAPAQARRILAEQAQIAAHYQLVERADPDGGGARPWYHLLAPDLGADSPLLLMLNQVTPEYYAALGATAGPDGELYRRAYLDAVVGTDPPAGERMLADIVGVTVRVRPSRAERLTTVLTALGYRADSGILHGPRFTVAFDLDAAAAEGVTEVAMELTNPPAEPEELRFGKASRLVLDPAGSARWIFNPVD